MHLPNQPAEDYVENFLISKFRPHTIIIGYDRRFGKERKGDYLLLEMMAVIPKVSAKRNSQTRIG